MASSSFAFIPRQLAAKPTKRRIADATARESSGSAPNVAGEPVPTFHHPKGKGNSKEKSIIDNATLARLLVQSLSEYAIWSDPDLRSFFTAEGTDDHSFVPLSFLLQCSPLLYTLESPPSEGAIVHAIRAYANECLEVRMLLADVPSRAVWFVDRMKAGGSGGGGYEVRRKDWKSVWLRARTSTSAYWEKRTVYLENTPFQFRSPSAVLELVTSLLPPPASVSPSTSETPDTTSFSPSISTQMTRIQSLSFPPHHADPPDAPMPALSKGFAFITFTEQADADLFLHAWPWDSSTSHPHRSPGSSSHPETQKAKAKGNAEDKAAPDSNSAHALCRKSGLRALSKTRWDALKEEYLAYGEQLRALSVRPRPPTNHGRSDVTEDEVQEDHTPDVDYSHERPSKRPRLEASNHTQVPPHPRRTLTYPPNVLLFVRNVPPGTTKTALRTILGRALGEALGLGADDGVKGVDYADLGKGLDSCFVRMTTPAYAEALARCMFEDKNVQLEVELVQGKKEELYWADVPERVRIAALEKFATAAVTVPESAPATGAVSARPVPPGRHDHARPPSAPSRVETQHYPPNVLLFARNLHPETNKTTLRAFFARALVLSSSQTSNLGRDATEEEAAKAVDYVDFVKGIDSCHLRMTTPHHAASLVEYFKAHGVVQMDGLDQTGTASSSSPTVQRTPVVLELVTGTKERLYWEKVPEKVRRAAVESAVASGDVTVGGDGVNRTGSVGSGTWGDARGLAETEAGEAGKRVRKRRRGEGGS